MPFEYKQFDVLNENAPNIIRWMTEFGWKLKSSQRIFNRSSRPTGAVTYQNLTYIHTETEVDDFTELLFERDVNMPFYDEVCELEEEANYLLEFRVEQRPLPCPPPKSYGEWFKINKPRPFGWGKRLLITFFLSIITVLASRFAIGFFWGEYAVEELFPFYFVGSIILSLILSGIWQSIVRITNKNNKKSRYYKKMYAEYEAYCEAINEKNLRVELHDRAHQRIPEILREVRTYVK